MPTVYPTERNPSDAEVIATEGTTHAPTGIYTIPAGAHPTGATSLRVYLARQEYQLARILTKVDEGRVVAEATALRVGVKPRNYILGGVAKTYDGSTGNVVTDAAINYVYLNASNVLVINTTGYPTDVTNHVRLGRVVCASGTVSAIYDDRGFMDNAVPTATTSSDTGTDETDFTIDASNAGAGNDTGVNFNRGSTAGDARIGWNEASDRFDFHADQDAPALASLNVIELQISGASMVTADGAAKVDSAVAGDGLQETAGVLSVKASSALGTSASASGIAVDPSDGIAIDANGVAVAITASKGLELVGTPGSKTLQVDVDDSTIQADASGVAVKAGGISPIHAAVSALASGGAVVAVLPGLLTGGNTHHIFTGDAPFKFKIIDCWSIAKSADGGTWKLTDGTNDITDTVSVTATDKTRDQAGTIDDAYSTILLGGSLRVVGDGANADADVYIMIMRVT